jgi:hypothetical protein
MVFLTLFVQSGLADGTLRDSGKGISFLSYSQSSALKARWYPAYGCAVWL